MSTANKVIPVQVGERIQVIDVLRGFAVLGILLMNMRSFSGQAFSPTSWPETLDRNILILIDMFAQAKFYSLFSFLFGWGMAIQMSRAEAKGIKFIPFYMRRLIVLFIFGGLHSIFLWTGDILTMYSLLGIALLLLFSKRSGKVLLVAFAVSLLTAIVMTLPGETMDGVRIWCRSTVECLRPDNLLPSSLYVTGNYIEVTRLRFQEYLGGFWWVPCYFGNVFAMMLLGLYVGKRNIFKNIESHLPIIRRTLWIGLAVGLPLNGLFVYSTIHPFSTKYASLIRIGARTIGAPALTLFYITAIILYFRTKNGRQRLIPLSFVGRMALSNYILHSVIGPLVFYGYGLGLYGETDPTFGLILTIVIYLSQIRLSQWWLERYQYGPLEWLWRTLSYAMQHPFSATSSYETIRNLTPEARKRRAFTITAVVVVIFGSMALFINKLVDRPTDELAAQDTTQSEVAEADNSQSKDSTGNESANPAPLATPITHPVNIVPGPIAASGDLQALAETFNAEMAYEHIKVLAARSLEGRYAGSSGGYAAGEYIAKQFSTYGLQPVGDNGTYFQEISFSALQMSGMPHLGIVDEDGSLKDRYRAYQDFKPIIGAYAGGGQGEGDLIWVVNCTPKDFRGLNVVGMVVFCRDGDVQMMSRLAVENGAAGLLLLADPTEEPPDYRNAPLPTWIPKPIPVYYVYPDFAGELLTGSGYSLSDLSIIYTPVQINKQVNIEVSVEEPCANGRCTGRNVLGVLPGSDPAYSNQIMIVSANYDHVGSTPDGRVWPGANGNASGIAVLLEIARSWQEQGYIPKVTTLFVAWDASEQETTGAEYYIQNPVYPLDKTIAVLQLDQLGAGGDSIQIDGSGLANLLMANVRYLGLETTVSNEMDGDHRPFVAADVPADMISWGANDENYSHTRSDTSDIIQLEKLEQAGQLADLVLLGMADGRAGIEGLLAQRADALVQGDLTAFLRTSTSRRQQNDEMWFKEAQSLAPVSCTMTISSLQIAGNTAHASVGIQLEVPTETDGKTQSLTSELPVLFVHTEAGWQWDGPDLATSETITVDQTNVTVHYPADVIVDGRMAGEDFSVNEFGQHIAEEYIQIANTLSLTTNANTDLYIYSRSGHLQADTSLLQSGGQTDWVDENTIKITFTPIFSDDAYLHQLLSQLVIANAGIPHGSFQWMLDGLPLVLEGESDRVGMQMHMLPSIRRALAQDTKDTFSMATSWAAVDYLRQTFGWDGLGRFITNVGRYCQTYDCKTEEGADQAIRASINLDQAGFNIAWQNHWQTRLDTAQAGLNVTLDKRSNAVLNGDETSFLQTVDRQIPNLFNEEIDWFADLSIYRPESFTMTAEPLAFLDDGSVLASVNMEYQLADVSAVWGKGNLPLTIRFAPSSGGYLWSGPLMQTLSGGRIRVRYPEGQDDFAKTLLIDAESFYSQLATEMQTTDLQRLTIKLYEDEFTYRSSIALSFPAPEWAPGWSAEGQSIKLLISQDDSVEDIYPALVAQLSRQLLLQSGIQSEWLLMGASSYLSRNVAGGALQRTAASSLTALDRALRDDVEFDIKTFPGPYHLSNDEYRVAIAQAWDMTRYLAETYGQDALFDLLASAGTTQDLDASLRSVTGLTTPEFDSAWKASLSNGHLSESDIATLAGFDVTEAQKYIDYLTSPELAGRQAGSAGNALAAEYIAESFTASGLQVEQQVFPVRYQTYLTLPSMALVLDNGGRVEPFSYRDEFIVLQNVVTDGVLSGDLIWVADENYTDMELDGKIVVRKPSLPITDEIKTAQEHGAGALILIGDKTRVEYLEAKYPFAPTPPTGSIPVYELTPKSFNRLLELTGESQESLFHGLPVTVLNADIRLQIRLSDPELVETANVIGLLPGSNPDLQNEYVIIGAHYDHVGDEVDTPYSGANDNASGVATMLEIARLWRDSGYRPERSVLFIAWGAQEPGELGSQYFFDNPLYPVKDMVASIQLDSIGGGGGYYLEAVGSRSDDGVLLFSIQKASDVTGGRLSIAVPEDIVLADPDELFSPAVLFQSSGVSARTDNDVIHQAGIPTILLRWQKASELNLPDEFADEVLPERLDAAGKMITAALMMIAR